MAKHFLYLTNDKLVALVWHKNAIVRREVFGATELRTPQFKAYIESQRELVTSVVTDLIEEDFRLDTVPHLRGNDSEAVIGRKLAQLYRASPFRHGLIQGREEIGRRDDRVLYHAVTNAESLKLLMAVLESAAVPLAGSYSSAVLSGCLLDAINVNVAHSLLVTIVPDFGLRQTYFQNKQFKFSRLTPIIFDSGQTVGQLIADETHRTWQYLEGQRFFASGEQLEVSILLHQRDLPMVRDAIRSFPDVHYQFHDIVEIANAQKLRPMPTSSHAEELLCHLFAQRPIDNHFASSEQRRFHLFRRARTAILAMTAVVLAVAMAGSGYYLFEAGKISTEIDRRSMLMRPLQLEYREVISEANRLAVASDTVRDSSLFFKQFMRPVSASPGDVLRAFSKVFVAFPHIQLRQIVWSPTNDESGSPAYSPMASTSTDILRSVSKIGTGSPATGAVGGNAQPATDADPTLSNAKFQAVIIDASISPFDGDYRKAAEDINALATRISEIPGVKATVIALPLDVRSSSGITLAGAPQTGVRPDAHFVLRLVRNVKATGS